MSTQEMTPDQMEFEWGGRPARPDPPAPVPPKPKPAAPKPAAPRKPQAAKAAPSPEKAALEQKVQAFYLDMEARTGMKLRMRVTANHRTILSVKHGPYENFARVSIHHLFLNAPEEVKAVLAYWIQHPKAKKRAALLDEFIRENRGAIQRRRSRKIFVRTKGRYFDLAELYEEVNREHFEGAVTAHITWGKMPGATRRRSMHLGTYNEHLKLVRIHPLLDQSFVPREVVRFIVFHELLHAHLGITESDSGRRQIHPRQFRQREKAYPGFAEVEAWVKENLSRLLQTRRRQ